MEELKKRLMSYTRKDLKFNEPHFTQQLILREGNREEVIQNLLKPSRLVYSYYEKGVHCLYFRISNTRTMKIPVKLGRKTLYIITYIMRYRSWQGMRKR